MVQLFFEVQRERSHVFIDLDDAASVLEMKRVLHAILKVPPSEQQLSVQRAGNGQAAAAASASASGGAGGKQTSSSSSSSAAGWEPLADGRTLAESGFGAQNAKAQTPHVVALTLRDATTGDFEPVRVEPLSTPPPLPDVMRQPDTGGAQADKEPAAAN